VRLLNPEVRMWGRTVDGLAVDRKACGEDRAGKSSARRVRLAAANVRAREPLLSGNAVLSGVKRSKVGDVRVRSAETARAP